MGVTAVAFAQPLLEPRSEKRVFDLRYNRSNFL